MEPTCKLKVGDRVKLISNQWIDDKINPKWNGVCGYVIGTITLCHLYDISVIWDNRYSNSGYIFPRDLALVNDIDIAKAFLQANSKKETKPIASITPLQIGPLTVSRRKFGIELETIHNGYNRSKIREACTYKDGSYFIDFHSDSSIDGTRSHPQTLEIVTEPLNSENGLKDLLRLCTELKAQDFQVNESCGYHVHLSTGVIARDVEKIKTLLLFYWIFEEVFFSFLPKSRRRNHFCRSLHEIHPHLPSELIGIKKLKDLECLWYEEGQHYYVARKKKDRYDQSRYAWANFHCLFASTKNLEIRSHSGTIDPVKIIRWIRLHDTVITAVRDEKITFNKLLRYVDTMTDIAISLEKKTSDMFRFIQAKTDIITFYNSRQAQFSNNSTENLCAE